jgi:hypothetical protein
MVAKFELKCLWEQIKMLPLFISSQKIILVEFESPLQELKLSHYFNRHNYPQGNGRVERSFRTDEEEFYQVEKLPPIWAGLRSPCSLGTGPTNRFGLIRLWVINRLSSSTRAGLKTTLQERRSCPICPDPVHGVDKGSA